MFTTDAVLPRCPDGKALVMLGRLSRLPLAVLTLSVLVAVLGFRPPPASPVPPEPARFGRHVVDAALPGAAFLVTGDLQGDRRRELVVTAFGRLDPPPGAAAAGGGELAVYRQTGDLDHWSKSTVFDESAAIPFPNEPALADVDHDGDTDIVVAGGFFQCAARRCGSLSWWERRGGGWIRHDVVAPGTGPLFYHRAVVVDFDRDGLLDLVTVGESFPEPVARKAGEPAAHAWLQMFRGVRTPQRFSSEPVDLAPGGGALPSVADVDRDGDLDVASAQYFQPGASYVWLERITGPGPADPDGSFATHPIDASQGRAIELRLVPDLHGEGQDAWVGSNHTNTRFPPGSADPPSQLVRYRVPEDPREGWAGTAISEGITARPHPGQAAPGVFGDGDLDGDGDTDLLVSGDGDDRLFWLEQRPGRVFATHVLATGYGQAGGAAVGDLDRTWPRRNEAAFTVFESGSVLVWSRDGGGRAPAAGAGAATRGPDPAAPGPFAAPARRSGRRRALVRPRHLLRRG